MSITYQIRKVQTKPIVQYSITKKSNEQGWPNEYTCNFLEPGIVSYEDVGQGVALLQKPAIDTWVNDFKGKPVVIGHSEVTPENFKRKSVGYITGVWYDVDSGWYKCTFLLTDDKAKEQINQGYSVSCAFDVEDTLPGGEHNAVKYDEEITRGTPEHLAIVDSPRYEGARVVQNGRTVIWNSKASKIVNNKEETKMANEKTINVMPEDRISDSTGKSYKIADLITHWNETQGKIKADPSVSKEAPEVKHPGKLDSKKMDKMGEEGWGKEMSKKTAKKKEDEASDKTEEKKEDGKVIEAAPVEEPKVENKEMGDLDETETEKEFSKKEDGLDENLSEPKSENPKEAKKDNTVIEALPSEDPKVENEEEMEKKEDEEESEGVEEALKIKKSASKGVNYFMKLNTLKSVVEPEAEMIVDTLKHRVNRGINRYASKEVK